MSVADPHLMLAFEGTDVPDWLKGRLAESPPAGVTLFREWNMESPAQVAELTSSLQALNSSPLPLLIAVDQEGGQLIGLPGSTPFAGNMALGAANDPELARRVAMAMGAELGAVGANLNYAPVADVATQPDNPSLGVRSFGDDPEVVSRLTGAMIDGFRSAGILSTVKHFPGKGEARSDPHHELPLLDIDRRRLDKVELAPFREAIAHDVDLTMMGHYLVPSLTGSEEVPTSASPAAIAGVLRGELGFGGLVVSDALDMGALDQGPAQVVDLISMMRAGVDLLLCMPDLGLQERVRLAVERGVSRGLIDLEVLMASKARISRVIGAIQSGVPQPKLVGSPERGALALELARRSVTVVKNDDGLLPLRLTPKARILSLEPTPTNVTPADTTALYPPQLGTALRTRHPQVTEVVYPHDPDPGSLGSLLQEAGNHDVIVIGTVTATPGQVALVEALIGLGTPVITVALRTPWDLGRYPLARTHICTYSSHQPSLLALTDALFDEGFAGGTLPVVVRGYARGHRARA